MFTVRGNKSAFDPPHDICNPHALTGRSKHAGNMTRGRIGRARPPNVSASSDSRVALLELTGSFQAPGHRIYLHSLL